MNCNIGKSTDQTWLKPTETLHPQSGETQPTHRRQSTYKHYKISETGAVDIFYEVIFEIYSQDDSAPKIVRVHLTYEILKHFHIDLKLIARMSDIDTISVGELPSNTQPTGEKILDHQMIENIEKYFDRFKDNASLLNLTVFKKLISDNAIDSDSKDEEEKRATNPKRLDLLRSIKNEKDIFSGIEANMHHYDSEEEPL